MEKKAIGRMLLLVLISLGVWITWGFSCTPVIAAGDAQAILRPEPAVLGLKPGDTQTIQFRVEQVQNLYGLEIHLTYDPAILEVVDSDNTKAGVQVQPGDFLSESFVAVNQADNATGKIDFAVTLLNPAPAVSGDGVIASVVVKGKAEGVTRLHVEKAILASREASEIRSGWEDAEIGVSPSGKPPSDEPTHITGPVNGPAGETGPTGQQIWFYVAASLGVVALLAALVVLGRTLIRKD